MTTLPAADYFSDALRVNSEAKTAQDDTLAVIRELLGGTAAGALTIASGSITPTTASFTVDTEAAASTDDLATIAQTNHTDGRVILLSSKSGSRTVVVKHGAGGTGQIFLADAADLSLADTTQFLTLQRSGTSWVEIMRAYGNAKAAARTFLGTVDSIADDTNGGINFSASTGAVTANLEPSDLLTKATPTTSDSLVIQDAAASDAAKTATIASMIASAAETLAGTDARKWLTAAGFAGNKSLGTGGNYKFPGGLIMQWGNTGGQGIGDTAVTFSTAFPTAAFFVMIAGGSGSAAAPSFKTLTASGFTAVNNSSLNVNMYWLAFGN